VTDRYKLLVARIFESLPDEPWHTKLSEEADDAFYELDDLVRFGNLPPADVIAIMREIAESTETRKVAHVLRFSLFTDYLEAHPNTWELWNEEARVNPSFFDVLQHADATYLSDSVLFSLPVHLRLALVRGSTHLKEFYDQRGVKIDQPYDFDEVILKEPKVSLAPRTSPRRNRTSRQVNRKGRR
jgi:hypothetical protein